MHYMHIHEVNFIVLVSVSSKDLNGYVHTPFVKSLATSRSSLEISVYNTAYKVTVGKALCNET